MTLLEVKGITKSYGNFKAVDEVSFKVESGKIYGMLGPNGAGKTTTIRMIMNIIVPDSGQIQLFGQTLTEDSRRKIGYLPEERGIFQKMKVLDLLVFFGELRGVPITKCKQLAGQWLEKLELTQWANNKVEELSKGMQQKIQFIATIIHDPELVILDEPFSGLDPVNVNLIKDIMLDIKQQGKTIIFSTHMMDAAEKLCDEIIMINKGRKVLDGAIEVVRSEHGSNNIRLEFSGDHSILKNTKTVKKVIDYPNYAEVELEDDSNPNQFLQEILPHIQVHGFSSKQTSLNEIFLKLAGGSDNA